MTPLNRRTMLKHAAAVASLALVTACGGGGDAGSALNVGADGVSAFDANTLGSVLDTYPMQDVSATEAAALRFMREEEMLAHAVYANSARLWPAQPIFGNIAASEATHAAAVKALLDRYAVADPLATVPAGTLVSPDFLSLQATLVAASQVSAVGALTVGGQIEELDLSDLQQRTALTDNADILLVYENLARGSRNHLRAFVKALTALGASYTPRYLSLAQYQAIIDAPMETGR